MQELYEDKELIERLRLALHSNYIQKGQLYNMLNAGFITMKEYAAITSATPIEVAPANTDHQQTEL